MSGKREVWQAKLFNSIGYVLLGIMVLALPLVMLIAGLPLLKDGLAALTLFAYLLMILVDFPLIVLQYATSKDKVIRKMAFWLSPTFGIWSVSCGTWIAGLFLGAEELTGLSYLILSVAFIPALAMNVSLFRLEESRKFDPALGRFIVFLGAAAGLFVLIFTAVGGVAAAENRAGMLAGAGIVLLDLIIMTSAALLCLSYLRTEHRYLFILLFACSILSFMGDGLSLVAGSGLDIQTPSAQFFYDVMLIAGTLGLVGVSLTRIRPRTVEEVDQKLSDTRMQMEDIVAQSPDAMGLFQADGTLRVANARFRELFHLGPEQGDLNLFGRAEASRQDLAIQPWKTGDWRVVTREDVPISPPPGQDKPTYVSIRVFPTCSAGGKVSGFVYIAQDTTGRKSAEDALKSSNEELERRVSQRTAQLEQTNQRLELEIDAKNAFAAQIQASLQEKEVLLKEIHHRVKNNLQIVSSLLSLQSAMVSDPSVVALNLDCQNRIRTMALIHEKLYQTTDLSSVDFGEYVRSLTAFLQGSFRNAGVRTVVDVDQVRLDIDRAIPCGLIINELYSNCMKHAFKDREHGEVYIGMRLSGDHYQLTVRDDGRGMARGFDPAASQTLGLNLVKALAGQLEGEVQLGQGSGTEFNIRFPAAQRRGKPLKSGQK